MLIELNAEEVDIVRRLVETRLKELGPEIHHTRSNDFKDALKDLRSKLERLEQRLCTAER